MPPVTVQHAFELAVQHHQAGRLAEAEGLYRQILGAQPNHAGALHMLGVIGHQVGRHDLAVEFIRQALQLDPSNAAAHSNLGEAYRATGRVDEAIGSYRRALQLNPEHPQAHNNLGNLLRERGRMDEAIAEFRQALNLHPDYAEALNNLGIALAGRGELEEAIASYRRALQMKPEQAETHYNLGNALGEQSRLDEAVAAYRRAIELKPEAPEAHNNLGSALRRKGCLGEAILAGRRAIELKPDHAEAYNNLGLALADQEQFDDAVAACRQAVLLNPDYAEAYNNLGVVLAKRGEIDEAIAAYRQALGLAPDYVEAHYNMGLALAEQGQIGQALAAGRQALRLKPTDPSIQSNIVFMLHYDVEQDGGAITEEQARWNRQFSEPGRQFHRPHGNDKNAERRIRIGYVSPDFRHHVLGWNLWPLFRCHDPREFEILCYSGVVKLDGLTDEFRDRAKKWRSTVGVPDEGVAEMIREDGVDILVDLAQHSGGNRLTVFARRPAPVQVSFAGYPESTGMEAIEYRISDRWLEAEAEIRSAECGMRNAERVFLIDSFWCYDPYGMPVAVNELPAKESRRMTFGSLSSFCKVNEKVLKLWACVLRQTTQSRLLLLSAHGSHRQRTLDFLAREGVEPGRVEFLDRRQRQHYLELYHQLDIVLDPFPYGGHTTSLDALWMGVPVVSLAGERAVSRAGLSILNNLRLPELVAFSEGEYVRIATELAGDLSRLAELRRTLRSRMEGSVLMDGPRFARNIEAAYRAMWRQWCGATAFGDLG